jgi:hypothetical protein
MTGKTYIDGNDAYLNYGIFITAGGYKELSCFPPMKDVSSVDWWEEDGIEPDLSDPKLDTRDVAITFAAHRAIRVGAFFELIADGAYHTFDLREIGRVYKLRLVSESALNHKRDLQTFTLRFANDFPLPDGYTYQPPQSSLDEHEGYDLDGRSFVEYGVRILQGSLSEVLKSPAVKLNLLQNFDSQNGATYDGEVVRFQSKEVKLNCLMRAATLEEFWRNYNALLFDLVRPGERSLYVDSTGYEYPCYYKSCGVTEFYPTGKIWWKFDITLVFISFHVGSDEYILVSEAGEWIITEDGEFAIDLDDL